MLGITGGCSKPLWCSGLGNGRNSVLGVIGMCEGGTVEWDIRWFLEALQADSLLSLLLGKPRNTGVGSLSLLQGILPIQESNRDLLCCRRILYQLSYQRSPEVWQWCQLCGLERYLCGGWGVGWEMNWWRSCWSKRLSGDWCTVKAVVGRIRRGRNAVKQWSVMRIQCELESCPEPTLKLQKWRNLWSNRISWQLARSL